MMMLQTLANDLHLRRLAAEAVAVEAGHLGLEFLQDPVLMEVKTKGLQDFVSAADGALEKLIVERVAAAFPKDGILGEEGGFDGQGRNSDVLWVVDPIDGTSNFVRGRPGWCVSIGLVVRGEPVIGVVYDPVANELYSAMRGEGATRNGHPIEVSGRTEISGATLGLGFSYRRPVEGYVRNVRALLEAGCEFRRSGTGALDLAWVADGRLDGYIELHINAWDVMAGLVLVREAGGWTNDFLSGDGLNSGNAIYAFTPDLRDEVRAVIGDIPN